MLLHSVAVQNQDPAADAVLTHDLAVNPLSAVLICLRPLNDTGTLANYANYLEVCGALNQVNILHRGRSIVSATGRDLAALNAYRYGCQPWMGNGDITNNERRCVVLPVFLGRRPYDPRSCFPASRAGELQISLDVDVADTGYDDLQYTIETVEILGATPVEYERKVQLSQTFAATGIRDVDLPVGNVVRGALLFGTTPFGGAAPAPSWGRVRFVGDGVEMGVASSDFEVQLSLAGMMGRSLTYDQHIHAENDTGGPTGQPHSVHLDGYNNYAFLDLDPNGDDQFSVDTSKLSRFQVRADAETADAVRVIPIERVAV